jgi:integrase
MPFTDKQVAALKPKTARYEKKEPGRTGLGIRVGSKGDKTWTFLYRFDGKQRRMVLGHYPRVGVAKAHAKLAQAREELRLGIDPGAIVAEARETERNAERISDLAAEYLERHARKVMRPSSSKEDERLLNREVLPDWRDRRAKDITRRDCIRLLDTIEDRGAPVLRNRTAGLLSRLFRFAIDRGIVDASPASGIRRLPEEPRSRVLDRSEIRSFWLGLDNAGMSPQVRLALKFVLLTGQRRGEVAGISRDEIDDDEQLWRLPAQRAKNGRENLIPLPPLASEIVAQADALRIPKTPQRPNRGDRTPFDPEPSPWLFRSTRRGKPVEPAALTRALNRNRKILGIADATVHDLRRTFATWHSKTGTPLEVISALLNHAPNNITGQVYIHATNPQPRRIAMERWCAWLAAEQGDAQAQFDLALMYSSGLGVIRDDSEAAKWFHTAAEQGHARSQNALGLMYAEGSGIPQDNVEAYKWFNLAAAQPTSFLLELPDGKGDASENRDALEEFMAPTEIAEAQRLSLEWLATNP